MLADSLIFPQKVPLARLNTPLVFLPRLSAAWGDVNIWMKRDDLTGSLLTGNKVRKLEYVLQQALELGLDGVVTAGSAQSNHCRATAAACAQLGLKCHLLLRETSQTEKALYSGNCFLSHLMGATIHWIERYASEKSICSAMSNLIESQSYLGESLQAIPIGASDDLGLWGYIECAGELKNDCAAAGITPSWMACASGSSGTQAGLTLGAHLFNLPAQVIGMAVCDNAEYFEARVRQDVQRWSTRQAQWQTGRAPENLLDGILIYCDDRFIGKGYGKASSEVLELIKDVARLEGIALDPVYTAKAMLGVKTWIREGKVAAGEDIVFIHTGGVYGLFPYAEQFNE